MANRFRILLVDNDEDFLALCVECLESFGYETVTASNPPEARRAMREQLFHLAVLDLRLVDDSDEKDRSGLGLAKEFPRSVPKIILTKFPTHHDVRDALRLDASFTSLAVDFLDKEEGLDVLPDAVGHALRQHVRINWQLLVQFDEANPLSFVQLAGLIAPTADARHLLNRAEELEGLFRRLFFDKDQIRIDRILWRDGGRAAVLVHGFTGGKSPESYIMVCGTSEAIEEERRRYERFAPKAQADAGTIPSLSSETQHFAANSYVLVDADLENIFTLSEVYRSGSPRALSVALKSLYTQTLVGWHQGRRVAGQGRDHGEIYCGLLGLSLERSSHDSLAEKVRAIVAAASALGVTLRCDSGALLAEFGDRSFVYPDPTAAMFRFADIGAPVILVNTPGTLTGEDILVGEGGRTWVTNFAHAGLAPLAWNYLSLEAAIRFDWAEASQFRWLYEMERSLLESNFGRIYEGDVEAQLRKPVRSIGLIRRLAAPAIGGNSASYELGLLLQAMRRVSGFDPTFQLTHNMLMRLTHCLLAAAMLYGKLQRGAAGGPGAWSAAEKGIRIDKKDCAVWVEGVRVDLRGHGYELLTHLYDNPDRLCTRRELIEKVFGETYDESDLNQVSRLNTAIHRLRKQIEEVAGSPRYLLTEQGEGYRLNLHGDK